MKADNKIMEPIMVHAANNLNLEELRVFTAWIIDAPGYSAAAPVLQKRLPKMSLSNIRRALKGLQEKGFLIQDGRGTFVDEGGDVRYYNKYLLNQKISPDFESISPEFLAGTKDSPQSTIPPKINQLTIPTNRSVESESVFEFQDEDPFPELDANNLSTPESYMKDLWNHSDNLSVNLGDL